MQCLSMKIIRIPCQSIWRRYTNGSKCADGFQNAKCDERKFCFNTNHTYFHLLFPGYTSSQEKCRYTFMNENVYDNYQE